MFKEVQELQAFRRIQEEPRRLRRQIYDYDRSRRERLDHLGKVIDRLCGVESVNVIRVTAGQCLMLVIAVDRCKRDTGKAQPANKAFRERGFSDAASALCASNESAGDWWSVCFMFCFGCHEFFCCFFHFVKSSVGSSGTSVDSGSIVSFLASTSDAGSARSGCSGSAHPKGSLSRLTTRLKKP